MFGLSLTKILFTVLAIVAVWTIFKWVRRVREVQDHLRKGTFQARHFGFGASAGPAGKHASIEAEDMKPCPACGTYVMTRGARACGRGDCPYPG